ncbi:hypothetical protein PRZ48_013693 [Zasmidium cellare]|uniref:SET domain-containing protein n=1 Tax=Zasmidium cellare TaxID=395010 RepID=A0ABR0E1S9_ZASCE|nr:hypothetical protein PRZ48_013693 [Zasmidium cellare]
MAADKSMFTPVQRELLAAQMRTKGDTQGLDPNDFTKAVLDGKFDDLIAKDSKLIARLPPNNLRVTENRFLRGRLDPTGVEDFITSEKKVERGRVDYAMSMKGTIKPAWNYASAAYNKSWQRQNLENARQETRRNRKRQSDGLAVVVPFTEPYAPCSKTLDQMEKMLLKHIRFEDHHTGKFLVVQVMAEPLFDFTYASTIVEDENSQPNYLSVHHAQVSIGKEVLPKGAFLAIKEPYFTAQKNQTTWNIRVDHPGNIVRLTHNSPLLPLAWRLPALNINGARTAAYWKEEGNKAIKSGKMAGSSQAAHYYTEGLACVRDDESELKSDLLRNRAAANLELGRYDAAKTDALAAINELGTKATDRINDLNFKAYRRAALAAYKLRQWSKAKDLLVSCLELKPEGGCTDVDDLGRKADARLREQSTGEYSFDSITTTLGTQPRVDVADYFERTEVKASPIHGCGLFATKDIAEGDIIMVEKAAHIMFENDPTFCHFFSYEAAADRVFFNMVPLWHGIVRELDRNPSRLSNLLSLLPDTSQKDIVKGDTIEGNNVLDVFQIHDLMSQHVWTCEVPSKSQAGKDFGFAACHNQQNGGIWLRASMMNHSCLPNSSAVHIGDLLVVRATKPIKKGDEILVQYRNDAEFEQRQAALDGAWGFTCSCPRCVAERSDSPETRDHRRDLVHNFMMLSSSSPETDKGHSRGEILERLDKGFGVYEDTMATYDSTRYDNIPQFELIDMAYYIMQIWSIMKPAKDTLPMIGAMIRHMNWDVDLTNEKPMLACRDNSIMDPRLVIGLLTAAKLKKKEGKKAAVKELETLAARAYRTLNGVDDGFEALWEFVNGTYCLRPTHLDRCEDAIAISCGRTGYYGGA